MPDDVCGLPHWRGLNTMRRIAFVLCLLLITAISAEHALGPRAVADLHLAENGILLGLIVAVVLAMRRADEFIRRMHLMAATVAFIVGVVCLNVFEVLQRTGAYNASLGMIEATLYFPWAITLAYFLWRYR